MSIGGSASQGNTSSRSDSFGEDLSYGSNVTGGKGGSNQSQDVYAPQAPHLQNAWNAGGNAMNQASGGINQFVGQNPYQPTVGAATGNLMGMSDPNTLIDAQANSLQAGLQDTFANGLNMIGGDAAQMGAYGGDRHGLREAALGGELADAYTQGYGDIVANSRNQAINANNSAIAGAGQGFNMGIQGELARMAPAQGFAQMLGGPTVLGSGQSFNTNYGQGQDFNYGYNEANSRSSGSDEAAKFGFGLK